MEENKLSYDRLKSDHDRMALTIVSLIKERDKMLLEIKDLNSKLKEKEIT